MWPLKICVLLSRFLERRCKCAHENLKKTGSIEYISKRGYSHSISRLSVEPAAFGTWMKITASEAQSAWGMAGLCSAEVCPVVARRSLLDRYAPYVTS